MRKTRNSHGFTMAEMLIVIAIILVLAGVAFIAVQNHQRSMAQLERNAIAKELFIAAQNHLTIAESEGYPVDAADDGFFGTVADDAEESATPPGGGDPPADEDKKQTNAYYVIGPDSGNILDLMLPFGSIDETVRAGGSYLIRYQTNPARVLDVFYVTTSGNPARFNKEGGIGDGDYDDLMEKRESLPTSGYVLGYYGGEEALTSGDIILAPTVEIHNEERLTVTVTDYNIDNDDTALKLIISGETSKAKLAITLTPATISKDNERFSSVNETDSTVYTCILDDVTTAVDGSPYDSNIKDGLHFADLNAYADPSAFAGSDEKILQFWQNDTGDTPTFLPGENITVQAVSFSNTALTNIAYSSARVTNSLFADSQPADVASTSGTSTNIKAMIGNFRHLENLDVAVSRLRSTLTGPEGTLVYTEAEQIVDLIKPETPEEEESEEVDLSWSGFVNAIKAAKGSEAVNIFMDDPEDTGTVDNCYRPVDLTYTLNYNGNHHKIEGVKVDYSQNAGLFGAIGADGSRVHDLELIDFSIKTSSGNAGALAGKMVQATALTGVDPFNIRNVVAYNTPDFEEELEKDEDTRKKITVSTTDGTGSVGGLVGAIEGATSISRSAAALIVESKNGDAGGLIGKSASTGTVSGCYAGGHTIDSAISNSVIYDPADYNVTAGGAAGGLIGDAGSTEISYSYSTCSATGTTVGGLIGTGSGAITSSYCTGKVSGTTQGAFAGECGATTDCHYFEIINEQEEKDASGELTGGYTYLYPVPGSETVTGIKAIDETAQSFNDFCGASDTWQDAVLYNTRLKAYYGEGSGDERVARYNLRTVEQLGAPVTKNSGAEGDTTIDDFVATHYGDWPAPEIFVVNTK